MLSGNDKQKGVKRTASEVQRLRVSVMGQRCVKFPNHVPARQRCPVLGGRCLRPRSIFKTGGISPPVWVASATIVVSWRTAMIETDEKG